MSTAKSSKTNHGELDAPPTDLELMLYVDGELDEARHRQVEAYMLREPSCRAKVAGLDLAASVIRERALSSSVADGIADAVMAKIGESQLDGAADRNGASVRPLAEPPRIGGSSLAPRLSNQAVGDKPANDNARGIFALAAVAVAAAAALMIWGRTEAEPPRAAARLPAPPEAAAPLATPTSPPLAPPNAEGEGEPGVEVAAVDFGARMGTIFYVPQGAAPSSATTTVVWLSDEGPGGN